MAKERESLMQDLHTTDDEEEPKVDIEDLVDPTPQAKHINKAQIDKIAQQTGFPSRQPRKKRSKTKYIAQLNIKVREGVRPLFQEISTYLETFDNETFELALLALIEKKGTKEHLQHFKELTK